MAECLSFLVHVAVHVHIALGHLYNHANIPLTQDGATPLFIASQNGHSDVVNILIKNGADINLARNVYYYGDI